MRRQKGKDTRSQEEHMEYAENVDDKEKIRNLEQEVKRLQQAMSICRNTCDCHGQKGNLVHINQMDLVHNENNSLEGGCSEEYLASQIERKMNERASSGSAKQRNYVDAVESDNHHTSKKEGAHKKQPKTPHKKSSKSGKGNQTTIEQIHTGGDEMDRTDTGHNRSKADTTFRSSQNMSRKKTSEELFQIRRGNHANSNKMDLVDNENYSMEAGACSKEYQASQSERTVNERTSSQTAEQQNSVEAAGTWEDRYYDNTAPWDEELFSEKEERKTLGESVTNLDEHDIHFDSHNYNHNKNRKEGRSSRNNTSNYAKDKDNRRLPPNNEQNIISEIDGDLFTAPSDFSLAHCVAADLSMGSGIAVTFKQRFKRVDELMGQRKKVGDVAILEDNGRYIYYLITKKFSTMKPRIDDLMESVCEMRKHMVKNEVTKLAIPRIGCGLDRLDWKEVQQVLINAFNGIHIEIVVYNFTMDTMLHTPTSKTLPAAPSKIKLRVKEEKRELVEMESKTFLLLFGTVSGDVDKTMKDIDNKFSILLDYKKSARKMGDIIELYKRQESLYILIVKESTKDSVSYSALMECLRKLLKSIRKYQGYYMAFEAFTDCNDSDDDDLTVRKIVNMFKIMFAHYDCELWICWPPSMERNYENYQSVCPYRESNQHRESNQYWNSNPHRESNQYGNSNPHRESNQYGNSNPHRESNQYGNSNPHRESNQYWNSNPHRESNQYWNSNQHKGSSSTQEFKSEQRM